MAKYKSIIVTFPPVRQFVGMWEDTNNDLSDAEMKRKSIEHFQAENPVLYAMCSAHCRVYCYRVPDWVIR